MADSVEEDLAAFKHAGIPTPLADTIRELMDAHPELGYKSLSGFATAACQMLLRELHRDLYRRTVLEQGRAPRAGLDDEAGLPLD